MTAGGVWGAVEAKEDFFAVVVLHHAARATATRGAHVRLIVLQNSMLCVLTTFACGLRRLRSSTITAAGGTPPGTGLAAATMMSRALRRPDARARSARSSAEAEASMCRSTKEVRRTLKVAKVEQFDERT